MTNIPIGGDLIGGGWINQSDISNTIAGTAPWAASSYSRGIPIRQCRSLVSYKEKSLHISGLLGVPTSRRIEQGGALVFNIWFDNANAIEVFTNDGASGIPSFRQRDPFQLVLLQGYDVAANFYRARYYPRVVAEHITPIWDEESDPRKCIGMEVVARARGAQFLLPDDGDPTDATTIVGAYCYYLANLGTGLV